MGKRNKGSHGGRNKKERLIKKVTGTGSEASWVPETFKTAPSKGSKAH